MVRVHSQFEHHTWSKNNQEKKHCGAKYGRKLTVRGHILKNYIKQTKKKMKKYCLISRISLECKMNLQNKGESENQL